ncbi:flagellar brake protein [Clostridium weizhouense]|uniref:PilZ domain-containing protein n=1 Tax=Clostridium weizhouense TaxID=2859781 RepID=A0ABS7AIR2_9CLOT|nr:PilZ domain-containing protein [Clostridium weizhouense]MBW6408542.1 PilZ domain-containing protein [Clostridium weizhouense]
MAKFNLKINDRIEVLTNDKVYKSLIQDIGEDFININLPVNDGEYLTLKVNDNIEINSYVKGGSCFNFHCEVLGRGREDSIIYYTLSKPDNIKEIQRRDFARVDILNSINYKKITEMSEEEIEEKEYDNALMVDLSGGGIRFKTKEKLKIKDIVIIEFTLNGQTNHLKAEVVRCERSFDNEYIYGVKFLEISEKQRDKIIREIFKVMRKQIETL